MSTFAVVPTFFDASAVHQLSAYEEAICQATNEAREAIGRFILALDLGDPGSAQIQSSAAAVGSAIAAARQVISKVTVVSLT